jgi:hypothetical protein
MSNTEAKAEAIGYLQNGKEILSANGKLKHTIYTDAKYVKLAGHAMYNAVLMALDHKFPEVRKGKGRPSVDKYRDSLAQSNKKMLGYYNNCYEQLHLVAGYDGFGDTRFLKIAIEDAKEIINWATAA